MSLRQASSRAARAMGSLVESGASRDLDTAGLELALYGQALVRTMCLSIVSPATITAPPLGRRSQRWVQSRVLTALETSPATVLRDVLRDDLVRRAWAVGHRRAGAPAPRPLSELLSSGRDWSGPARAWREVVSAVVGVEESQEMLLLAGRVLRGVTRQDLPVDDRERWSAVADAAAVAVASHVLDGDLLEAARRLGAQGAVDLLEISVSSGLGVVARRTLDVARAGELADWGSPRGARSASVVPLVASAPVRAVEVTDVASAVEALRRLPALITAAAGLDPAQARQLCRRQARALRHAAGVLARADTGRARAAEAMAPVLETVTGRREVAPLVPGDVVPVGQQMAVIRFLAGAGRGSRDAQVVCAEVVDVSPAVVAAVDRRVKRSVARGQWAVADGVEGLMWVPSSSDRLVPAISVELGRAREAVERISAGVPARRPVAPRSAREVLAGRVPPERRPARPGVVVDGTHADADAQRAGAKRTRAIVRAAVTMGTPAGGSRRRPPEPPRREVSRNVVR